MAKKIRTVLVVNSGSSSIKYQLIDPDNEKALAGGTIERIGEKSSHSTHKIFNADGSVEKFEREIKLPTHKEGLEKALKSFETYGPHLDEVNVVAVGHRVVQGGDIYTKAVVVDQKVINNIKKFSALAPLHNPANLIGIEVAKKLLPSLPQIAVFDTAFFVGSLKEPEYLYAIDKQVAKKNAIRRYGFHGTSHEYVGEEVAKFLKKPKSKIKQIVLHIGNGASISAQDGNRAIDTSMGLTPLEGLVMGTRSGDIDPAVTFHLYRNAGLKIPEIDNLLNKKSGLLGLAGKTDMRDILKGVAQKKTDFVNAFEVYNRRIAKYIGSYYLLLGGLDALTFTAGVGENQYEVREKVGSYLKAIGGIIDPKLNKAKSSENRVISAKNSKFKILVIPTNEELSIAKQSIKLL